MIQRWKLISNKQKNKYESLKKKNVKTINMKIRTQLSLLFFCLDKVALVNIKQYYEYYKFYYIGI